MITRFLFVGIVAGCFASLIVGCAHGVQPSITLSVTDCPTAGIVLNPAVSVVGEPGRWNVEVTATVTCNGAPVNGAEISVEYPFIATPIRLTTDAQGSVSVKQRVQTQGRPNGRVTVTIRGQQGVTTEQVSY